MNEERLTAEQAWLYAAVDNYAKAFALMREAKEMLSHIGVKVNSTCQSANVWGSPDHVLLVKGLTNISLLSNLPITSLSDKYGGVLMNGVLLHQEKIPVKIEERYA